MVNVECLINLMQMFLDRRRKMNTDLLYVFVERFSLALTFIWFNLF